MISWKKIDNLTTFRSPNAKLLDYVVFYGTRADSVISTYRKLSGQVPMLPLWAYGFWQCRERYTSGDHLVQTVNTIGLSGSAAIWDHQLVGRHWE